MSSAGSSPVRGRGGAPVSQRTFELRCADVHRCRCGVVFRGPDPRELVALAREHGELVHCFTPAYYRPERLADMLSAAIGPRGEAETARRRLRQAGRD